MTRRATIGAAALAALAALATAATRAAPAAAQPAPQEACYVGEIRRTLPTGEPFGYGALLLRRTLSPAGNLIVEQSLTLDADEQPRAQALMIQVDGARLVVAERGGALNGTGETYGEPWRWTGWSTAVSFANGTGSERVAWTAVEGGLQAERRYFSPNGELRMVMSESYREVSPVAFDQLWRRLAPQ